MRLVTFVSRQGIVIRAKSEPQARRLAERALAETRLARAVAFSSRDGSRSFVAHAPGYAYAN